MEQAFEKEEVDLIIQIPFNSCNSPDKIIWKWTSIGMFTVECLPHASGTNFGSKGSGFDQ